MCYLVRRFFNRFESWALNQNHQSQGQHSRQLSPPCPNKARRKWTFPNCGFVSKRDGISDGIYFYSGKLLHFAFPFTDRQNDMTVFTAQSVPVGPNMICNLREFLQNLHAWYLRFTFNIIQHLFRACHLRWQEQDLRKDLQILATEVSLTGTIFLLSWFLAVWIWNLLAFQCKGSCTPCNMQVWICLPKSNRLKLPSVDFILFACDFILIFVYFGEPGIHGIPKYQQPWKSSRWPRKKLPKSYAQRCAAHFCWVIGVICAQKGMKD